MPILAFLELRPGELLIILFIVLLLFGSTKLPQLARALGSSVKEFKKGAREDAEEKKPEAGAPASHAEDSAKDKEKAKAASEKN